MNKIVSLTRDRKRNFLSSQLKVMLPDRSIHCADLKRRILPGTGLNSIHAEEIDFSRYFDMSKKTRGFTLVELMIILAIIGILASMAISSYQDYTIRAKVAEGLNLSHSAKIAVAETHGSEGRFLSATNASYGLPNSSSINGDYVSTVAIGLSGLITITYNNQLGGTPTANGKTILLNPIPRLGSLNWDCRGGTLISKYRPSECR